MKRFWISWVAGEADDCRPVSAPAPFRWWCTGSLTDGRSTICAVMDAESEEAAYEEARKWWPELEPRFCLEKAADYMPSSDRFQ